MNFIDGKGKLIGREVGNDVLVNREGKVVARYIKSSDRTVDGKGKNIGIGDQKLKQLKA
jgi:hypothetical protein